ncbi:MATE family efflux transporter, partial [Bilophila wadsworthia]
MHDTPHSSRWASLWALTWPQMLMLLVQFGIGLTDVWAAGRIGPDIQASIGLIAQCHMVLMAVGIATGNGAVAAVSQSIGAGRQRRARRFTGLVLLAGMVAGICLAHLGGSFRQDLLHIMQTPQHLMEPADTFLQIYLWTLPGQYLLAIVTAVLRAVRSVRLPLVITLV